MSFFIPFYQGALFEASGELETKIMADFLDIKPGDISVDLGSGDGRIVIELAKRGVAKAVGYEIDEKLVKKAKDSIEKAGVGERAFVYHQNFWDADLSGFNKISVFQISWIMRRLEKKLENEFRPGSLVVSHHWQFPNWQPIAQELDIYLYKKP